MKVRMYRLSRERHRGRVVRVHRCAIVAQQVVWWQIIWIGRVL